MAKGRSVRGQADAGGGWGRWVWEAGWAGGIDIDWTSIWHRCDIDLTSTWDRFDIDVLSI